MAEQTFRLPDIGEGIAEAELTEWLVAVGDVVQEDDIICEVTTDKATVEIPAAVSGRVSWLGGAPGETMAIGSDLIRIETDAPPEAESEAAPTEAAAEGSEETTEEPVPDMGSPAPEPETPERTTPPRRRQHRGTPAGSSGRGPTGRPLAAPSVRGKAREMGIDLRQVRGTGPAGRILHEDLDDFADRGPEPARHGGLVRRQGTEERRVSGVRRSIAERMALSKSRIPHYSIIEEVEVEALEDLRASLNGRFGEARGKLTILPFLLRALSEALVDHPGINATFDDEAGVVTRHYPLHCGIATQTDAGLMVPVLKHAEANTLWENAHEIRRLSQAARDRRADPGELKGSTITITSLGPLGALATTPVINHPEVAVVGINKIAVRPVWNGAAFVPRRMMNVSCSFDHRVVDGWDGAKFVATLKALLETPAMLFMEWRDE